jgi:hypothetical protein
LHDEYNLLRIGFNRPDPSRHRVVSNIQKQFSVRVRTAALTLSMAGLRSKPLFAALSANDRALTLRRHLMVLARSLRRAQTAELTKCTSGRTSRRSGHSKTLFAAVQ